MIDFERLLGVLHDGRVEHIIVGGVAATVHGATRLTQDVDVVYDRAPENLDHIAAALRPYAPYLRGAPAGLPFDWSAHALARGLNFTLTTTLGDIDLLGEIPGGGTFTDLLPHTVTVRLFGKPHRCIDLPALIRAKRAAGRPRDLEALAELEILHDEERRGSA